jgi:putative membrane protein
MRKFFPDYLIILLKGMGMGAADVVPGVSGGTIAFISGIYQELIESINNVNLNNLKKIKTEGVKATWNAINGSFLFALFCGIAISIVSLSKLITHLLEHHPILVWSFFFGLIVASILLIFKQIERITAGVIFLFVIGTLLSYYITIARPMASPDSYWFLFFSGFIAIIAMILPGVSGAFILLLLGSYESVLHIINSLRESLVTQNTAILGVALTQLAIFGTGCVLGLKTFSKTLNWMFAHHKNATLALLVGFMLGSLNKVWPWKTVLETRINSHGKEVAFLEKSIFPTQFTGDTLILQAIFMALTGFLLIYILEKSATKKA